MPLTPAPPNAGSTFPGTLDVLGTGPYDPTIAPAVQTLEFLTGAVPPEALTGVFSQSIPDVDATSSVTMTAGTVFGALVGLRAGWTVTNLSIVTAVTAASTPTNQWAGLAYPAEITAAATSKVVAISADGLTAAMAADTVITFKMATAYLVPKTDWYLAFFCVAATTGPTAAAGVTLGSHGRGAVKPWLSGPGDTGKTTPYTVGATVGALTAAAATLLVYVN